MPFLSKLVCISETGMNCMRLARSLAHDFMPFGYISKFHRSIVILTVDGLLRRRVRRVTSANFNASRLKIIQRACGVLWDADPHRFDPWLRRWHSEYMMLQKIARDELAAVLIIQSVWLNNHVSDHTISLCERIAGVMKSSIARLYIHARCSYTHSRVLLVGLCRTHNYSVDCYELPAAGGWICQPSGRRFSSILPSKRHCTMHTHNHTCMHVTAEKLYRSPENPSTIYVTTRRIEIPWTDITTWLSVQGSIDTCRSRQLSWYMGRFAIKARPVAALYKVEP